MIKSQLLYNLITILSIIVECIVFKTIISYLSEVKTNKIKLNLMIFVWIIIISFITIVNLDLEIKLCIGMLFSIIVYRYNFNEKLHKILLICAVFWSFSIGIEGLSTSIAALIYKTDSINKILEDKISMLELALISKILLILVVPIIKSINIKQILKPKEILLITLPVVANILSIVVILILEFGFIAGMKLNSLLLVICMGFILLSNFSLIFIIKIVMKESILENENNMIIQKVESQYNHYLELQNAQLKIRKLHHDMNNHLICIENMNNRDKLSKNYINSLRKELKEWDSIDTTGNMIVDIILSERREICKKENISFHSDVNFTRSDFIDMMDVCSIFSNILDNSIEATLKIKDINNRNISIIGNDINKFFVIRCENSKVNNILGNSKKILTDKKNKFIHGLGVTSIKNSVEKYNGTVAIEHTEDKFTINIYIPKT